MPELPDLTVYAKNLRKLILNRPIADASVFNRAKVNQTPEMFDKALAGQSFVSVEREGKELCFTASNGKRFCVHLMLNGKISLVPQADLHAIFKKIIAVRFEDGEVMVVTDALNMCRVTMNPPRPSVPDALSDAFTPGYLKRMTRLKALMNIKALLIDQHIVRGIGNAYADEILYRADISPKSIAGKIPDAAVDALYEAIRWVLLDAIEQIERISPDIISGEERSFLRVHHAKKKTAENGEPILHEEVAKKSTYFTAGQKLYL